MKHRGEIVDSVLKEKGIKKVLIIKKLKIGNSTLYRYLSNPELPYSVIKEIGIAIDHNFQKEFPDMPLDIQPVDYVQSIESKTELRMVAETWKNKYLSLLERHTELLEKK